MWNPVNWNAGDRRRDRKGVARIGLVNNMPDAALVCTEQQFLTMLENAADGCAVEFYRYSISGIERGPAGKRLLVERGYRDIDTIEADNLDGLIVTGTEPKQADLRDEPYWTALTGLFDWIAEDGPSAIFSCLAAHAAVLHYDGIERIRLPLKCSGIFDHRVVGRHVLTGTTDPFLRVAHSRWNDVRASALERAGYQVLTYTPEAGVDLFVKDEGKCLVFFQGHPEYDPSCLLREYKRDIRRFLLGQSDNFPAIPAGYFDSRQVDRLEVFAALAQTRRDASLMSEFPCTLVNVIDDREGWKSPAIGIYRNWLSQLRPNSGYDLAGAMESAREDNHP